MRYYSTNHSAPDVSLREALVQGQAPDRGLYLPRHIPRVDRTCLESWRALDYPELACEVLTRYSDGEFPADVLLALCRNAYTYAVPLEKVYDRNYLLRLDQGPTASFKDFAARLMARLISYILAEEKRELVILTATSGDTGSAVAHAFHGLPNVRCCVLFPVKEVSDRQRRQMTTLSGNIFTIGIDGKFDDGQAMVKRAFADPDLRRIPLSSANSINIGRLLPQSVYYVWAYFRTTPPGEDIVFCVPSGNFGNMMGGMLAWRMGLPVRKMLVATNANDEFPTFLKTGDYHKIEPSINALSNAMNVGHPSNLARLVALYGGRMRETGEVEQPPDVEAMRRELWSVSVDDEWTRRTIRDAYRRYGILLEPHGAVGWAALEQWLAEGNRAGVTVTLETAHPAKFPEQIVDLLHFDPPLPPSLVGLDTKREFWKPMAANYEDFKAFLKKTY